MKKGKTIEESPRAQDYPCKICGSNGHWQGECESGEANESWRDEEHE